MTSAKQQIQKMPQATKQAVIEMFGSLDYFYDTFYLMMQNEHQLDLYRPEGWAQQLNSVQFYRRLATEKVQKLFGLNTDLLDDIYSDYFEDFAHYRTASTTISNEVFHTILKKLVL